MGQVPRPERVQVERPADTGGRLGRGGRLDDVHLIEQGGRQRGEVRLLGVDLVRRDEDLAVEHGTHLGQAANVHRGSDARVAIDLNARDALQGIGDGRVGQLADALGRDAVLDALRLALDVDCADLRGADARDDDGLEVFPVLALGRRYRARGGLHGRLRLRGAVIGASACSLRGPGGDGGDGEQGHRNGNRHRMLAIEGRHV